MQRDFREHAPVLDLGCGRGEMLQVFREAGIAARGIDSNDDSIALCQANGLDAEKADLFAYLSATARMRRWAARSAARWWSICRRRDCRR